MYSRIAGTGLLGASSGCHSRAARRTPSAMGIQMSSGSPTELGKRVVWRMSESSSIHGPDIEIQPLPAQLVARADLIRIIAPKIQHRQRITVALLMRELRQARAGLHVWLEDYTRYLRGQGGNIVGTGQASDDAVLIGAQKTAGGIFEAAAILGKLWSPAQSDIHRSLVIGHAVDL